MSIHRNDIVVWCQHGETSEFVQRYRWMTGQGVWVPVDTTGESNSFVRGRRETGRLLSPEEVSNLIAGSRQDFSARCKRCPNKVPMKYPIAQMALTRLSGLNPPIVTMSVLRHVYGDLAKKLH